MSFVKFDFLNWQPDQDPWNNEGLVTADNMIHTDRGYIQHTTYLTADFVSHPSIFTTPSIVARPVGTGEQVAVAYLHNATAAGAGFTIDFSIGLMDSRYSGVGLYTTYTSSTISSAFTGNKVIGFDVCELNDRLFFTAQAELPTITALNAGAPVITINSTGYASV
jgi:hypothetical protein